MFGIFGKDKKKKQKTMSREDIIKQAQLNARKAREEIGEENVQRMADALRKIDDPKAGSDGHKAREEIRSMDKGKVADNLKIMLDDK